MQHSSVFFVALLAVFILATGVTSRRQVSCDVVRCVGCPGGTRLSQVPGDCCRCVPGVDCRTVFCGPCPRGTRPRQTPSNCCECVRVPVG